MTDLLRRIRRMTEDEGMRHGSPILLAVRVPDSVDYAHGCGLDVTTWLPADAVAPLVWTDLRCTVRYPR